MKKVLNFVVGFVIGVGVAVAAPAAAATLVGYSGYLSGWTVTYKGNEICYMPYVWTSSKEIECD